jgi:Transposase DDE domain
LPGYFPASRKKRAIDNDFRVYLSEKYVEKYPDEVFKTKTELATEILKDKFQAYEGKIPKNKVTLLTDASYAVKHVLGPAREKGLNYVGRLKKNRQIRLISRWMRVDKYFDKYKKERYFTHEGVKVFYKQAILQVSELGRVKVFRLKEESEAKYRYYVASKMNMTAKTCYRYQKSRWSIEDMHRDGKQYCGMKNTCAWEKESLLAHYAFVFFLWWLFERFRVEQGLNVSFESLWWEYCKGVDQAKMQRMQLGEPPPIAALFNYV